ncbi:hypothetical protein CEXT_696491 [Caerostris extrusa]|uniref:Uncharacterized protein n=1 Tax=Caerostris extrusa TaxID=172846 RepID=A0AAV4XK43_CAEEX|nr:hypothetical protein CEXT_696491 [Caerostris extrusa]
MCSCLLKVHSWPSSKEGEGFIPLSPLAAVPGQQGPLQKWPHQGIFVSGRVLGHGDGLHLDKESNTMALICSEVVVVLAFDSRELLIQWQVKVRANLVEGKER